MIDVNKLIESVHDYIARAVQPLHDEIARLHVELAKAQAPVVVADVVAELVRCPDLKPVLDMLTVEAVADHLDRNPPPAGPQGERGADGIGVAGAVINRDLHLVLTTTDGRAHDLGVAVGKDGADFTEAVFDYDGDRTLTIKGRGGDIVKRLPLPIDRGFWREGMACEKFDIVTNSGSAWIALRDTKAKAGPDSPDDWRLFARKGRDAAPGSIKLGAG